MSNRGLISVPAIAALGIACVSAVVLAARVADRSTVGYGGSDGGPGVGPLASAVAGGIAASSPWSSYPGYGLSYATYYDSENSTSGSIDSRTTSDDY